MTDQEAIARAQKELDNSTYLAEVGNNAGLRTMHQNRVSWLVRVLRLARIALRDQEERERQQPITNADRIRAMSDKELADAIWAAFDNSDYLGGKFCDGKAGCLLDCGDFDCDDNREKGCVLRWLRQPVEEE